MLPEIMFYRVSGALRTALESKFGRGMLSKPPEHISSKDLRELLSHVSNLTSDDSRDKAKRLRAFAKALSLCPRPLSDGMSVAEAASDFLTLKRLPAHGNYFEVTTRARVNGIETSSLRVVNLDVLGIKAGGLLSEALLGAPDPLLGVDFYRFTSLLSRVSAVEEGRRLLSTPAVLQEASHVYRLFALADSLLPNFKSRSDYFNSFKKVMRFSLAHLKSGQYFADAAYGVRCHPFKESDHTEGNASPVSEQVVLQKKEDADQLQRDDSQRGLLDSLKFISASDDSEAYDKATQQIRAQMDTYLIACEQVLNEQRECVERMDAILSGGPPSTVTRQLLKGYRNGIIPSYDTMQRLPQDALDWFLLSFVHNEQMFSHGTSKNRGFGLSVFLSNYGFEPTAGYAFDVALSQFYLTHSSMIACFIILAITTGWNGSTVATLSPSRIRKTGSGYRMTGIKTKTNQLQQEEIEEIESRTDDKLACRAIELLLWHNKNVDLFAERRTESVFCPMRLKFDGPRIANLPRFDRTLLAFLKANNLPRITIRDYRNLRLNYTYVAGGGDIVATQIRAGHASLATTARYIRGRIQAELHDSNIRRYMRILAKSILWVTGRKQLDNTEESKAARRLLFPLSPHSAEKSDSAADAWLASIGEMRLEITESDAIHCCYQQKFYEKNLRFLISFNENRFLEYHLARIVFCAALHRLLKESPFSYIVRRKEFDI
ncbi:MULTISPECIES: hypothetical protein [unclassified Caballeronia]|uniref:hypothetical protein n=1 Tax=unclassified Caballeronia TaxID=2646786 RepID=UPI00285E12B1|nr:MULTISPECIES: hypothetical protein [unclassified Caballeronia]MDR5751367.1 hypothetical protein [Caballeronia sp. LZ024]MDR5844491.1 hypothetical protein [Caballeronia sp. LZ031]